MREPLIVLDQDLRVVTASRSFYEFFKVKPEETEGHLIYNLGNKQWDIPKLRELLENILPQKTTFDNYEVEHDFVTIGRRIMLLNARQIERVLGKERIILLAIEDITEHKQLENILKESEELYQGVFNNASDGILLLEKREGKIIHINPSAEKMLGYSTEESIGNKLQDIGFIFGMDDFPTIMQKLNKNGIINYIDFSLTTKSGQHMNTDIYIVDKTKVVQCNIRDVTKRKRAEEALRNEHMMLARTEGIAHIGSWEWDIATDTVIWSDELFRIFQRDPREGAPSFAEHPAFYHPDDMARLQQAVEAAVTDGTPYELELRAIRKDGETRVCVARGVAEMALGGRPVRLFGSLQDITDRKRAEDVLRISEERYRTAEALGHVGNWEYNLQTTKFWGSDEAKRIYGFNPEVLDFSTDEVENCIPERERVHQALVDLIEADKPYNLEFEIHPKNSLKPRIISSVAELNRDEHGNPLLVAGVIQDITERKQAEEELRQTLESLKKSFVATVQVMVLAIESRDHYTSGHQNRAADLASAIATEMGLPLDKIEGIHMAGSIHDIGKLSIPAEILSKPTKLTNIEFSLIKEHSQIGYDMLKEVESPWPLAQIVYQHHERMDGSGYPRNLKGDEIIIEARIMAVADVVEAMASHRPYRAALGIDAALMEIEKNRETLYDNVVADTCLKLFREKDYNLPV